jgi:hypothetical protein
MGVDEREGFHDRSSLGLVDLLHELSLVIKFFSEVLTDPRMAMIERFEASRLQLEAIERYRRLLHTTDIQLELDQLGRLIGADRPRDWGDPP